MSSSLSTGILLPSSNLPSRFCASLFAFYVFRIILFFMFQIEIYTDRGGTLCFFFPFFLLSFFPYSASTLVVGTKTLNNSHPYHSFTALMGVVLRVLWLSAAAGSRGLNL